MKLCLALQWIIDTMPIENQPTEELTQCRLNVGPPSTTLVQHWANIGSTSCVCWEGYKYDAHFTVDIAGREDVCADFSGVSRGNNVFRAKYELITVCLNTPWAVIKHNNISPVASSRQTRRCWPNVGSTTQTLAQHWTSTGSKYAVIWYIVGSKCHIYRNYRP